MSSPSKVAPTAKPFQFPKEQVEKDEDETSSDEETKAGNDKQPLLQDSSSTQEPSTAATPVAAPVPDNWLARKLGCNFNRVRALGYIGFASFNFSLSSVCVKYASRAVTSQEAVFWCLGISWVFNTLMLRYEKISVFVPTKLRTTLLLRCFIGSICVNLQFYALSQMVLTDAMVIMFTSPVVTFILGAIVLGESIGRLDFVCALISYCGVMFVTRPAFLFPQDVNRKQNDPMAVVCAFAASFAQACVFIAMRKLHELHYRVIINYFLLFGIGFSVCTLAVLNVPFSPPRSLDIMWALLGSGFLSYIGQSFSTRGVQLEQAGVASVMRYFDVVFVLIWDTTLLKEHVSGYSVLGGCIIFSGASIILIRRAYRKQ